MGPADWEKKPPAPPPPVLTVGAVLAAQLSLRIVCGHTWRGVWMTPAEVAVAFGRVPPATTVADLWLTGRFRCRCCKDGAGRGAPAAAVQVYDRRGYDQLIEGWRLGEKALPERLRTGIYVSGD